MAKILHVEVGGSYGGSLKALENYLAYSDRSSIRHDLLLYYPTGHLTSVSALANVLPSLFDRAWEPPRIISRLPIASKLAFAVAFVVKFWGVLRRGQYDLVHVNNTFTFQPLTIIACSLARVPVVAHARNPVAGSYRARLLARLLHAILCVNSSIAEELSRVQPGTAVETCYDGIVPPPVEESAREGWRRTLLTGDGAGLLIGSIGRLDFQKGYSDFIKAARMVADRYPHARFVIAGEGPARPELEQLIRSCGMSDMFHLVGFQAGTGSLLAALDVFVCSSRWEGGPFTVVEALALNRPVVSTRVGFVPDLLGGGLAEVGAPEEIAAKILDVLQDPDRERRAIDAYERARILTDPRKSAARLDDLFRRSSATGLVQLSGKSDDRQRVPAS